MKTPREILFQQHRAIESKLDTIRESALATVCDRRIANSPAVTDRRHSLREFLFSLRWHLAGMGAAWLMIVLLNLNAGHSTTLASAVPVAKIPPPQIILASLRENRRELLQLIQPAESHDRSLKMFPRSERRDEILTA